MGSKTFSYILLLFHGIIPLENVLHLPFVFPVPLPLPPYFSSSFGKSFYLFCGIEFCLSPNFSTESEISIACSSSC